MPREENNRRSYQGLLEEIERLPPALIEMGQLGPEFVSQELCQRRGNSGEVKNEPPVYILKADEGAKLRLGRGDNETLNCVRVPVGHFKAPRSASFDSSATT